MNFYLILIYTSILAFCFGVFLQIYGKWALDDNYKFLGFITCFISFFLFGMILPLSESTSTYEITNYCSLSRELKEVEDKKERIEIIHLQFNEASKLINDPEEVKLFKRNPSSFHFWAAETIRIFFSGQRTEIKYSIDKDKKAENKK